MRSFSRTLAAVSAVAGLAASSAACSSNIEEPEPEAVNSVISSARAEESTESPEESTTETTTSSEKPPAAATTATETTAKQSSGEPNADDDERYITEVGLGEAGKKASFPACDGRYILIVDSVVDEGDREETFDKLVQAVMYADPEGKEFTVPGQCGSLRKSVHGNDIYPIYLDFGADKDAACRAKSTYGGNVRPLTDGSFPDASRADVDEARLALDPC